jgi:hypothetical protein
MPAALSIEIRRRALELTKAGLRWLPESPAIGPSH